MTKKIKGLDEKSLTQIFNLKILFIVMMYLHCNSVNNSNEKYILKADILTDLESMAVFSLIFQKSI